MLLGRVPEVCSLTDGLPSISCDALSATLSLYPSVNGRTAFRFAGDYARHIATLTGGDLARGYLVFPDCHTSTTRAHPGATPRLAPIPRSTLGALPTSG